MSYLGQAWNQGIRLDLSATRSWRQARVPQLPLLLLGRRLGLPGYVHSEQFPPGGGNVAYADGSVRFLVKSSTSTIVVWSLGSRAGEEVISSDSY